MSETFLTIKLPGPKISRLVQKKFALKIQMKHPAAQRDLDLSGPTALVSELFHMVRLWSHQRGRLHLLT